MTKILAYARSNTIALAALFIALGGTSYAALAIPKNSVGNRQLKNHSISPIKFERSTIAGYVRDWAKIDSGGALSASRPQARLIGWNVQPGVGFPGGFVSWGQSMPASCSALATTGSLGPGGSVTYASAELVTGKNSPNVGADVRLSASQTAVTVAVICPQP